VRVIERPEGRLVLPLERSSDPAAESEALDALPHDLLEPALAYRAPGAALLPDQVDQQRCHLVALVAILDDRHPDSQVETLQLALRASDCYGEIVRGPSFEEAQRNLARSRVGEDFSERDHARPAHVGGVVAIEIALDLVEGIRC